MEIPQPASDPYSPGDEVTVYLGENDPDAQYHDVDCIVMERLTDDLDALTHRDEDRFTYRVKAQSTGQVLPVDFRHSDLVPTE
jgi:hypothetical protein